VRGPGAVLVGSVCVHDAGGIESELLVASEEVQSSLHGSVERFISSRSGTTTLTPTGEISAGLVSLLCPWQSPDIGASLFGATDVATVIHSKAGVKCTWTATAVVGAPVLRMSAARTHFSGPLQLRHMIGSGLDPHAANALVKVESAAYVAATYPFDARTIKAGPVVATHNSVTISTQDGWAVAPSAQITPESVDEAGEYDLVLQGAACVATCTPMGMSEAALKTLVNPERAQGATVRSGHNLVLTQAASGLVVTLYDVSVLAGPLRWGSVSIRTGQLAFAANRVLTAGVPGALYNVAWTDPDTPPEEP
jgi:hypothetical protein